MKLLQTVTFVALLLGICSVIPSQQAKETCTELHSEDSCSSADNPEQLHLAYTCMSTTINGKRDNRAPIVIVHGFTMFKEIYFGLSQFLAIKTARKVCAVDLRNHGESPWSDETDSKAMASDLALFMKTLDTDKIVIVGHSLGGKIAVEFALTYPDKVEKIVVEDMRPNGMSKEALRIYDSDFLVGVRNAINLIPKGSTQIEAKRVIASFYNQMFEQGNTGLRFCETLVDYIPIKCSKGKCSWKPNMDVLDKIFKAPLTFWHDSSGKSEKPALFIYGEKSDFKVADVKKEIFELFPGAKLHKVKGRSHVLNDSPEYRKVVLKFINAQN